MMEWFSNLHFFAKGLVVLLSLPVGFLLVGLVVFIQEPPGESFWGRENPRLRDYLGGTLVIGFITSLILGMIFGSVFLVWFLLGRLGLDSGWLFALTFIICLVSVLYGIYYWFEGRHFRNQSVQVTPAQHTEGREIGEKE